MTENTPHSSDWTVACHLDYGDSSKACVVRSVDGNISVTHLPKSASSGKDASARPAFLGVDERNRALLLDPISKEIERSESMPSDARFAYAYRDTGSVRIWFMNDGDKDGNDTTCCPKGGSSVTIVAKNNGDGDHVETLCTGRGHHVTTFCEPTTQAGGLPPRAFVSNLKDGTISVVGNDPNDAVSFLKIISTINLCDPRREKTSDVSIPNNAFPHGMEFSPLTGKLYNLNNGYNTIAVIDPMTHEVEDSIEMKVSSNLLLSRCGQFLIGKGVDRKTNPEHVIGRLSVFDAIKREMVTIVDIEDFYPSVYRFNPQGDRLYVTAAATGSGSQADNLKTDSVHIYDTSELPALKLIKEIKLDPTTSGRRPIAFIQQGNKAPFAFIPNPTQGTLAILDTATDEITATANIGDGDITEFSFSFWHDKNLYGA